MVAPRTAVFSCALRSKQDPHGNSDTDTWRGGVTRSSQDNLHQSTPSTESNTWDGGRVYTLSKHLPAAGTVRWSRDIWCSNFRVAHCPEEALRVLALFVRTRGMRSHGVHEPLPLQASTSSLSCMRLLNDRVQVLSYAAMPPRITYRARSL